MKPRPSAPPAPKAPQRTLRWLTESNAGLAVSVLLLLLIGFAVVWALHPTFPPRPILLEPEEGSWSWLLHNVFEWGRSVSAIAAVLTAMLLLVWWAVNAMRHRI